MTTATSTTPAQAARSLNDTWPYYLVNKPVQANTDLQVTNKYTGDVAARVAQGDAKVLDDAIAAAVNAFDEFRRWPAFRKKQVLQHIARRIEQRFDELVAALAVEAGKPIKAGRAEVTRCVDTFTLAAEECTRNYGEMMPLDISPRAEGYQAIWKRVPIGPVSFITPFNFPINLPAHKIAPALAMGCPFVLKPAPRTPIGSLILGEMLAETDLPEGTFSILPVTVDDAGAFTTDERLKLLSFTGSADVGWKLKSQAGKKRVVLELGGNAGCIVDHDADIDLATDRIVTGGYGYSGQSCISVQRVLVHKDIYDNVRDQLIQKVSALQSGDPTDEDVFIGPLIDEHAAKRVEQWVNEASAAGAEVPVGGTRDGAFYAPTIIENPPADAAVSCKEIFGPVITIQAFDDFDNALRIVDNSEFGLQAGVFTNNMDKAFKAFDDLEVGGVVINDVPTMRVDNMPYGGVKSSGTGREGIRFAMQDMSEIRVMVMNNTGK